MALNNNCLSLGCMNIYKIRKNIKFNQSVNNFSQFNEDLYLAKIFEGSASGVCVDVGANDGVYGSNSALLEQLGWSCILVEPNISLYESILKNRRPYKLFQCVASDVEGEANLYVVSGGELAHGLSTMVPSLENIERNKTKRIF